MPLQNRDRCFLLATFILIPTENGLIGLKVPYNKEILHLFSYIFHAPPLSGGGWI